MSGVNDPTQPTTSVHVFDFDANFLNLGQHRTSPPSGSTSRRPGPRALTQSPSSLTILSQSTVESLPPAPRPPQITLSDEVYHSKGDSLRARRLPTLLDCGMQAEALVTDACPDTGPPALLEQRREPGYTREVTEDSEEQEGSSPERPQSAEASTLLAS